MHASSVAQEDGLDLRLGTGRYAAVPMSPRLGLRKTSRNMVALMDLRSRFRKHVARRAFWTIGRLRAKAQA
jgi:hypothetical protein